MENRVIAITGGASGMGLALVRLLASRNAKLSICDLNETGLAALETELRPHHPDYLFSKVNIAKEEEVNSWITATKNHFGHLDGAANCAGIVGSTNSAMPLTEIDNENWELCLGVNLTGTSLESSSSHKADQFQSKATCTVCVLSYKTSPKVAALSPSHLQLGSKE